MDWKPWGHWIFDMDGTLTVAVHDFAAFKRSQGMPEDQPILEVIATMAPDRAARVHRALDDWERELARGASAAAGARELLEELVAKGRRLGVLTRNTREVALLTLEAAGLLHCFAPEDVAGRDCAAHKPSPEGVLRQLGLWGAPAEDAVMLGDYVFDVVAGKTAGTATVLIDGQARFGEVAEADFIVSSLAEIVVR